MKPAIIVKRSRRHPATKHPLGALMHAVQVAHATVEKAEKLRLTTACHTLAELRALSRVNSNDIEARPRPLKGPRKISRARRYGRSFHEIASWPNDDMKENRIPLLIFVVSGQLDLQIGNYFLSRRSGDFVFVLPTVPVVLMLPDPKVAPCELLWLCPWMGNSQGIQCWLSRPGSNTFSAEEECFLLHPGATRTFATLTEELSLTELHHCPEKPIIDRGLLSTLMGILHREMKAERVSQAGMALPFSDEPASRSSDPIMQTVQHIRSHLNTDLSIDAVSRLVFMSRAPFTKLFRKHMGMSFNEFVTAQRLIEAKRLLLETDWSVQVVGEFVGLSTARLREVFKHHEKMSPSQYRAQQRAD